MLIPTIIMGIIALVLSIIGYIKGQHLDGIRVSTAMVLEILPILIFAFIIAGMIQVLLPHELLIKWIGPGSGLRGIFIGTLAGACTPGGPYVTLPIAAGLLRSGASIGTMVAFLTGWSLWSFIRLPMEVGIMGWRFMFIRIISVLLLPTIAGLIAQLLTRFIK